ncbi:hypothetical protein [Streptomyces sp. NPDC049585]|uniref:hypothetical protein n=1 Tax=Streptomyces sp. NPDC049585 TaxID=3155154 RepID=UPI00343D1400
MKRALSSVLSVALLGGALITGTAGTASATTSAQPAVEAVAPVAEVAPPVVLVDPVGERRTMCTYYKDKNACASLLSGHKMNDVVSKVVVAGATACLSSLT